MRRGSGGGGARSSRPSSSSGRPINLPGLQGVTPGPGVGLPSDPYAHTKKTRTKPVRNADGILIRKDGRPDMRSQSSAANLRKVHARKEEQKATSDRSFTPIPIGVNTSLYQTPHAEAETETPSPTGTNASADPQNQIAKKHEDVMKKMFPAGYEEANRRVDHAKVFEVNTNVGTVPHGRGRQARHAVDSPQEAVKREQGRERSEERRVGKECRN